MNVHSQQHLHIFIAECARIGVVALKEELLHDVVGAADGLLPFGP